MLPGDNTTMTVRNLRDGTTYDFAVRAYDASGNFSDAGHVTVATPEKRRHDVLPPAPVEPVGDGWLTPHTVDLASGPWSGSGDVFAYEVRMDGTLPGRRSQATGATPGCCSRSTRSATSSRARRTRSRSTAATRAGNLSARVQRRSRSRCRPSSDTTPPDAPQRPHRRQHRPELRVRRFFTWTGGGGEPDDVEIYEDGHFIGAWRGEAFMTSFGRRTYTIRAVDAAGNLSAGQQRPSSLDHGMRC